MEIQKKQDLDVFIGVFCNQQCRFQLGTSLQSFIELDLNVELAIGLTEKESKLFKVKIPAGSEEGTSIDQQISSITILASPMIASPANSQSDLILTATTLQNQTPSTSQDNCVIGDPVWTQGKAIRLIEESLNQANDLNQSKINKKWCTDCWVYILLSVQRAGKYSIIVKANIGESQIIEEDRVILGIAQYGELECYKYIMQNSSDDMNVKFKTYSGVASYSITPAGRPSEFKDSEFIISQDSLDTSTKITSQMRTNTSKGDMKIGPYFICIFAHISSSYQFMVSETDPSLKFEQIEDGFAYKSQIISQINKTSKQIFVYEVPSLEFDQQDIKLSFQLQGLKGTVPSMAIKYCNTYQDDNQPNTEDLINKCANFEINSSAEQIIQKVKEVNNTEYIWAQQAHGIPYVLQEIDHDEKSCKNQQSQDKNSNCFYIIVVFSNSPDLNDNILTGKNEQTTDFQLLIEKIQNNYQILRAQQPLIGQVGRNEIKYYNHRFYGNDKVEKISIQLNTIHGDADLLVSRTNVFPQSKYDCDKMSSKSKGVLDFVEYDRQQNDSLAGEYYIGVKGYSQSVFELQIRFQLEGQSSWNLMSLDDLNKDSKWIMLSEGAEKQSDIHNEQTRDFYRFTVDMDPGFERTIRINFRKRNDNDIWIFIAYGRPCTDTDYDIFPVDQFGDKVIEIPVNSEFFHAKGTYYIMTSPRIRNIFAFFSDDWYSYAIKYSLDGSFDYIHPQHPVQQKQKQNQVQQFKFILENRIQSQRLNIQVIEGTIQIKQSFDASQVQNFADEHTTNQIISQGNRASNLISRQQIQSKQNTKCLDPLSNCILYIGVKCMKSESDCYYQLKIQSKDDGLQNMIFGLGIQDTVEQINMNYYYIRINEKAANTNKPVFIILSSNNDGDADMYVSLQPNSDLIQQNSWIKPSTTSYDFKSQETISQDMIIIQSSDIKNCFQNSKQNETFQQFKKNESTAECSIIIGVFGTPLRQFTEYELIAYTNVQHLNPEKSIQSFINQNEYQYFIYELNCINCTLIIGLQTFSGGNPDLYINFGDKQLPDKEKYNFKSTSYSSDSIEISLNDQFFQDNQITSMKGTFIIGVYGQVKSSFILSASHSKFGIIPLQDQIQFHDSQLEFETKIFKYDPDQGNNMDDIRIEISINSGKVDLYVNTYSQDEEYQNLIQKLPTSKRQSIYSIENIKSTSQQSEREILFKVGDKNYCQKCIYLIGVHSHDQPSDYQLKSQLLSADFVNSYFLKVGSPQSTSLEPNQTYIFKFLLDDREDVVILQENQFGDTQTFISKNTLIEESFEKYKNSSNTQINTESKNFMTSQVYFIIVQNLNQKSMITLTVSQKHSIIDFKNGLTQKVVFNDENDITKNFVMSLPKGDSILTIQIQPIYNDDNYISKPVLFYKLFQKLGEVKDQINFPPSGDPDFLMKRQYQGKQYLQISQKINITEEDEGVAFTIWMQHNEKQQNIKHEVIVFASTSNEHMIAKNQEYFKTIFPNQRSQYLKLDESFFQSKETYTFVEYSNCQGSQKLQFLQNPEDPYSLIQIDGTIDLNGKIAYRFKNELLKNNFYIVVSVEQMSDLNIKQLDSEGARSQYTIKAFDSSQIFQEGNIRTISDSIKTSSGSQNGNMLQLQWEGLKEFQVDNSGIARNMTEEVNYFVFYTEKENANLNSVCTFEDEVWRTNEFKRFQTQNMSTHTQIALVIGKNYKINVIAQVNKGLNKGYLYSYHQIEYLIPISPESITRNSQRNASGLFLIIFALLFICSALCVFCFIQRMLNGQSITNNTILYIWISKFWFQLKSRFTRKKKIEQQQQNELGEYGGMNNFSTVDSQRPNQSYELPSV